jgi:NAD(P)-dependent dehydrogenase (short-subunit alcohol dehydrogenase family)
VDGSVVDRAVVISGASRGLGAAFLELAVARGARVLGLARSFPEPVRALADSSAGRVVLRTGDLCQTGSLPGAAELAGFLGEAGDVLLVNNAATTTPVGAIGRLGGDPTAIAVATNLTGTMVLIDSFLAALDGGDGPALALGPHLSRVAVLFVTSSVARRPKPGTAVYCATKAGGEMFVEVLRAELADDPRCVIANVDPGGMDTDMHASLRTPGGYFPDRDRLREVAAAGRLASPAAVAVRILDEYLPA